LVARVLAARCRGRAPPTAIVDAVTHPQVCWEDVVAQASSGYVLAALAAAIRDFDLDGGLEPELKAFLEHIRAGNLERNRSLRSQLVQVVSALNAVGIEPTVLKGGIRLIDDLYPNPAWRMMRDLDLLLPPDQIQDAAKALEGTGYVARAVAHHSGARRHHHHAPLDHPDHLAKVELHTELFASARHRRLLPASELLAATRPAKFGGMEIRIPSDEHQLVHLIGHAHIAGRGHATGRLQLRDRLEAALLARSSDGEVWQRLAERFDAHGYRRPLMSFMAAVADAGLGPLPEPSDRDLLAKIQAGRIALQSRSATKMWLGKGLGWYGSVLWELVREHERRRQMLSRPLASLVSRLQRGPPAR
jgi:hypothetical protein